MVPWSSNTRIPAASSCAQIFPLPVICYTEVKQQSDGSDSRQVKAKSGTHHVALSDFPTVIAKKGYP